MDTATEKRSGSDSATFSAPARHSSHQEPVINPHHHYLLPAVLIAEHGLEIVILRMSEATRVTNFRIHLPDTGNLLIRNFFVFR